MEGEQQGWRRALQRGHLEETSQMGRLGFPDRGDPEGPSPPSEAGRGGASREGWDWPVRWAHLETESVRAGEP